MNREIKFRAWNDEDGVMIDANHLAFEKYEPLVDQLKSCKHLMQFTGLLDKDGIEIFEGDILNSEQGLFEVKWESYDNFQGFDLNSDDWTYEVIGNIHQHPHSLTP